MIIWGFLQAVMASLARNCKSRSSKIATNFAPFGKKTIFSYLDTTHDQRLQTIWNQNVDGSTLSKFDYGYDALWGTSPTGRSRWTTQRRTCDWRCMAR